MAVHDYDIANANGSTVRSDLNSLASAIRSQNSNATAPSSTVAFQAWGDETDNVLKIRNADNNGWQTLRDTIIDPVVSISTSRTITEDDVAHTFLCTGTTNTTLELQDLPNGFTINIKNTGSAIVTVQSVSTSIRTIDGATSIIVTPNGYLTITSNGSNWFASTFSTGAAPDFDSGWVTQADDDDQRTVTMTGFGQTLSRISVLARDSMNRYTFPVQADGGENIGFIFRATISTTGTLAIHYRMYGAHRFLILPTGDGDLEREGIESGDVRFFAWR